MYDFDLIDGRNCFDSVLFYGNEAKLVLFDVLLFSLVDAYVHNYLTASLITYIFCKVHAIWFYFNKPMPF